jgi:hypothetical protein
MILKKHIGIWNEDKTTFVWTLDTESDIDTFNITVANNTVVVIAQKDLHGITDVVNLKEPVQVSYHRGTIKIFGVNIEEGNNGCLWEIIIVPKEKL